MNISPLILEHRLCLIVFRYFSFFYFLLMLGTAIFNCFLFFLAQSLIVLIGSSLLVFGTIKFVAAIEVSCVFFSSCPSNRYCINLISFCLVLFKFLFCFRVCNMAVTYLSKNESHLITKKFLGRAS